MRYAVVGGGIVGLATAHRILVDNPEARVTVLEKEPVLGAHQTGHNSGVIHAGVYYRPGSLKARLCRAGSRSMLEFCAEHGVPVHTCGKLIVATDDAELPRLRALHERASANGLPVRLVGPAEAREYEPAARVAGGIWVPTTAVVDFRAVCAALANLVTAAGGRISTGSRVTGVRVARQEQVVRTTTGDVPVDVLVNCAGLHADRVAELAGVRPPARIVPFRGEYYELRTERRELVRGLIYPVPDPDLPFLGVHLTRMIDGSVHAGPNAVLALAREGYSWGRVDPREVLDLARHPGLWRLARRHLRYGVSEVARSLSRRRFATALARLVPELTRQDLRPTAAGVRAQAVAPDGSLVDDFLIVRAERQVHVINAPSPAATSSLEIAKHIVARLPGGPTGSAR
ncbi:L-2-hydroxyglutarate oxidase [Plantactinospora sp. GCM10030261]|uniref:L-2-hydroxyglutarate oxidase n=1 Tax=Plantactinospora sp. GCM10030261 TaxID=3273420 RepID=UPI00360D9F18